MKKLIISLFFLAITFQASADSLNDSNKLFDWAEENFSTIFISSGAETIAADNLFFE